MADNLTQQMRSKVMRAIKSKATAPELFVRQLVLREGHRYRLNVPKLIGRPDLIFPGRKKVIFVHGCFWHAHFWHTTTCPISREPSGEQWKQKLKRNMARDESVINQLGLLGWTSLTLWECELKDAETKNKLRKFLAIKD